MPTMLTAHDISAILQQTLADGLSLCDVSILSLSGAAVEPRTHLLVTEAAIHGSLGDPRLDQLARAHALRLLADERAEIVVADSAAWAASDPPPEFESLRLLFEIARPALELIVCGGGHVGQAVARAGRLLDFQVTVIDDRPDFASREKFPDPAVRLVVDDFTAALRSLRLTPASHIVIVTRGHKHDEICLREVIGSPVRYLGMIGSRRRTTTIREHLRRNGVDPSHLSRVHAPIGLDIGAQTPEEIAIAILAEIVLVRRGGNGRPKSASHISP